MLSLVYIFCVTISSCAVSYILAIPFYLLIERPFKNFLDLILFPRSSIFKKHKDVDDEDSEEEEEAENDPNETTDLSRLNTGGKDTFVSTFQGKGTP
jgi:hypothetical protein